MRRSDVRTSARHVLRRLYDAKYVASLNDPVGKARDRSYYTELRREYG